MTAHIPSATIDVRTIPPHERHPLIFSTFGSLEIGQAMEIVNDHDPKPLHAQFLAELPDTFAWSYLETGPVTWRVSIHKVAEAHAETGFCCGSCGGH